jgi:hypothetical protein
MKKLKFYGIDVSNEISLLEYGLLVSVDEHEDGSGTHFCVYRIDENHFGCGHVSEKEINGYIKGEEFMKDDDIKSFLEWLGYDTEDFMQLDQLAWMERNLATKISDLLQYLGCENIFGTDYSPMTEKQAIKKYLR